MLATEYTPVLLIELASSLLFSHTSPAMMYVIVGLPEPSLRLVFCLGRMVRRRLPKNIVFRRRNVRKLCGQIGLPKSSVLIVRMAGGCNGSYAGYPVADKCCWHCPPRYRRPLFAPFSGFIFPPMRDIGRGNFGLTFLDNLHHNLLRFRLFWFRWPGPVNVFLQGRWYDCAEESSHREHKVE